MYSCLDEYLYEFKNLESNDKNSKKKLKYISGEEVIASTNLVALCVACYDDMQKWTFELPRLVYASMRNQ